MQAYTDAPQAYKSDVPPPVPTYRWTLDERIEMSKRQCPRGAPHKGRGRRFRREIKTRQALKWLADLRAGTLTFLGEDHGRYGLTELLRFRVGERSGPVVAFRARVLTLLAEINHHGPDSGWGIAQPFGHGARPIHWTPYMVPKAGEKCWRWWRGKVIALGRVIAALAWVWGKLVPPHRQLPTSTPTEEARGALVVSRGPRRNGVEGPVRMPWDTLATRSPHLFAM